MYKIEKYSQDVARCVQYQQSDSTKSTPAADSVLPKVVTLTSLSSIREYIYCLHIYIPTITFHPIAMSVYLAILV